MGQYTRQLLYGAFVLLALGGGGALRSAVLEGTLLADDYDHYAMQRGIYPVARGPLDTYDFVANPTERAVLMAHGRLPWWSDPALQLSVLRPLSSALTWADYTLFGIDSRAHHLHSLAWWALLVTVAALLLRALLPEPVALVATVLFVLEEGHNLPLAWAANRNELVALALGTLALWSYVRAQRCTLSRAPWLAPGLLVLALAGGEHALPLVAYFVAYECLLAEAPRRERVRRLLPIVAVALGYLGLRAALGHGIAGSGFYVSPFGTPLRFLGELCVRLPLLLADLVLGLGAEWYHAGPPYAADTLSLGLLEPGALSLQRWQSIHLGLAFVVCAAALLTLSSRSALAALGAPAGGVRPTRFFLVAALLALVPACAALPMSRLTLPAALAVDALLACALVSSVNGLRRASPARRVLCALLLLAIVLVHGVHAGRRARLDTKFYALRSLYEAHCTRTAELDDARVQDQRVLAIAARDWVSHFALPFARHSLGLHMPAATHLLSGATDNPHELTRVAPDAFELRVLGHPLPGSFLGSVYRPTTSPMHVGDTVRLPSMTVTVLDTARGNPVRARFAFAAPLHPDRDVLLYSFEDGLRQVALPAVGMKRRLPAPAFPHSAAH